MSIADASEFPNDATIESIKAQVNRGYIAFCRKNGLREADSFRATINAAAAESVRKKNDDRLEDERDPVD